MSILEQSSALQAFRMAKQQGETYFQPALEDADGEVIGRSVQTIERDAHGLFALWSEVSLIPGWQEYVVSVTPVNDRVSHWIMGDPEDTDGKRIEFDSEITEQIPDKSISWKSITEDVHQSGTVTFEETARGTRVALIQATKVPAGALGNAVAGLAKRTPRQIVTENLRHFKELAETGEIPSVKGQPHGPRGIGGAIKEWMYGENNPTPPGTSEF